MRLSMKSRKELTEALGARYRKADRRSKGRILGEFCESTGWSYPVSVDTFGLVGWATPRCFSSNWIGLS